MKVYELAKKLETTSVSLMNTIKKECSFHVKNHMEKLTPEMVTTIEKAFYGKSVKSKESSPKKATSTKTKKVSTKKTTEKLSTKTKTKKTSTKKITVKKTKTKVESDSKLKKTIVKKVIVKPAPKSVTTPEESVASVQASQKKIIIRRKDDKQAIKKQETLNLTPDLKTEESKDTQKETAVPVGVASKSMRLDLVSVKSTNPLDDSFWDPNKAESPATPEKKQPKKPIAEKDVSSKFNATDFRKREVIFQPRKKRIAQLGEVKSTLITTPKSHKRIVKIYGDIDIEELCKKMGIKKKLFIKKLKAEGVDTTELKILDYETIALIIPAFGFTAQNTKQTEKEILEKIDTNQVENKNILAKAPVVTIMGHVDHGKTTLLDSIRKAKVAQGEAGGITQHIGAYSVFLEGKPITFIDTPGHSAFTAMRSRGAKATDIVVILVAADDGVQPQTLEALSHAKTANTPFIIAISKIDVPGANIDRVKQQMSEQNVISEEWGGDVSFVPISGLKGTGIKELLEQIQLLAEMQELKYTLDVAGKGVVLESRKEKGLGCIVSLLVQDGKLKSGDTLVAGECIGRVRQMKNDQGKIIKEILAGFPVEMVGLHDLPQAGDSFCVVKNEKSARDLLALRKSENSKQPVQKVLTPEELLEKISASASEQPEKLNIILKADTVGSLEALKKSLEEMKSEEVKLKIIHSAAGAITESDVLLASTVSGSVFGFNVRPDGKAAQIAKEKSISIYSYSIIYQLLDQAKKLMLGLLKSDIIEEEQGQAEVRNIFHISKIGTVAGSYVIKGKILRSSFARLVRDGRMVYNGPLSGLRRFKDDVKQVGEGFECGISLEKFNDIKPKDIIECYIKKEQARTEI